ncbi:General transcription factor II-I repeat domain-containing 2 [Pelobates cultripes]|uniref:General transcription factor II-I repeat domain-containing 2 n=1 Tax=Pelobates cultripes TaxID=61616 RepID=A0AAD1RYP4_PELCU|nr:General transcription factor II-I repeat domain-containing 2 [Pelobates cultripes]
MTCHTLTILVDLTARLNELNMRLQVDITALPPNYQTECIELQSDIRLKEKFDHVSLLDFYKAYLPKEKYPSLHNCALFITSLFGSTYIGEQLFSRMKHMKSEIT